QFQRGLRQLEEEGATQVLHAAGHVRRQPIAAVVGELQFDVVLARLKDEYGVEARIERLPYAHARWVEGPPQAMERIALPSRDGMRCIDRHNHTVLLFESSWALQYCQKENPDLTFTEMS
ncbi:MAG: peptide chain release factor 3, partial [Chloroflexota bacterium]